jgi:AcrR family transcriptional regulator
MKLRAARPLSETSPDCRPPRRRRKEARPSELTAAALALFVEKGFAATRLDDVAARAGVSKGTLYLYFESKEALFKAVIEEGMVAALAAAAQRLSDFHGSAAELLQQLLFGWWEQIGQTPMAGVTKLIACESSNFPEVAQYYHERVLTRGRALLRTTLQRGVASGEFRPVDIETAIDVIMAPLLMLAISRFSLGFCNRKTTPETYLRTHFELLVKGLRGSSGEFVEFVEPLTGGKR